MRRWYHDVSAEWLEARKRVLTATDVAGLLPEYKRYLKAGSPDVPTPGFSAVWFKKHSTGLIDTGAASEAAARGHVMEPYAIYDWNLQAWPSFHHWDDCLVANGMLGFSPDALDVQQFDDEGVLVEHTELPMVRDAMEVKCYDPANHMAAVFEDRMKHKELMQVAMAFAVLPKLERVRVLWYCPGAPISMHVEVYTRSDLQDQCRLIGEIAEVYRKTDEYWLKKLATMPDGLHAFMSEEDIYADYIADRSDGTFIVGR